MGTDASQAAQLETIHGICGQLVMSSPAPLFVRLRHVVVELRCHVITQCTPENDSLVFLIVAYLWMERAIVVMNSVAVGGVQRHLWKASFFAKCAAEMQDGCRLESPIPGVRAGDKQPLHGRLVLGEGHSPCARQGADLVGAAVADWQG
jgi:hypothetical protein